MQKEKSDLACLLREREHSDQLKLPNNIIERGRRHREHFEELQIYFLK